MVFGELQVGLPGGAGFAAYRYLDAVALLATCLHGGCLSVVTHSQQQFLEPAPQFAGLAVPRALQTSPGALLFGPCREKLADLFRTQVTPIDVDIHGAAATLQHLDL